MNVEKQHEFMLKETQGLIDLCPSEIKEQLNDGYHTFKELYDIRLAYNVALFNEWASSWLKNKYYRDSGKLIGLIEPRYNIHKSWKHYDGELCFGGGWFIVVAILPTGQISNHYKAEHWNLFKIPEVEKALFPFDNHNSKDVINRLKQL